MIKQPEITDATRNNFIQAFCELYETKPIEKITVKEVAERAGYSRTTFYNYFKDVYDLLQYIEDSFISQLMNIITTTIKEDITLDNFILSFTKAVNVSETYRLILFKNPYSTQFVQRLKEKITPVFLEVFGISPDNTKAIYTFEFYIPGIVSVFSRWIQNENEMSVDNLAILIKSILQDGFLAQLDD